MAWKHDRRDVSDACGTEVGVVSRAWLCTASLICGALLPAAALADADSSRNVGVAWLVKQQRGDGSWANSNGDLDVQATSAALLALKNGGLSKSPTFGAAAAWLTNADADSVDSIARKVEALAAAGLPGTAQSEADRLYSLRTVSAVATWGGYGGSSADYVDTALALAALRLGDASYSNKAVASASNGLVGALCNLATSRISVASGKQAWPVTQPATNQGAGQGRPSVLSTALLLNELRSMQKAVSIAFDSVTCAVGGPSYSFTTLQNEARAWLLDQQNADGGFGEQRTDGSKGSSSVIVSALVYRALNNQPTPPQPQTTNAQTWLLAQQNGSTGSWRNDPLVTAQVLAVLPAAAGAQLADADRDGVTDLVEAQLGSNQNVADARDQLGSPTLATPGSSVAAFTVNGVSGQPFTYSLGSSGPYSLMSGSLPPGLSLNPATGLISGTPTQVGSYSFDYQTSTVTVIGRIDVADEVASEADVPIPDWAVALLAGTFLFSVWTRQKKAGLNGSP